MDFDKLYRAYFQTVYGFVLSISHDRHIAEDIVQETFLRAMKKIDSFKADSNAKTWLCQIAKNLFYDYSRHTKRNLDMDDDTMHQFIHELYPSVEESLIKKETAGRAYRILRELEETYRNVFSMRVIGELSFSDIGTVFGKSDGWARVTYYRAKCRIREELKNENEL